MDAYLHEFAFVNKSYANDLRWTVVLYRSWLRSSAEKWPFYIIVPNNDLEDFSRAFGSELKNGHISWLPILLSEESFFSAVGIEVPLDFDGWRVQQIVKLAFAKTGYARNYVTLDSSMLFDRPIGLGHFLSDGIMNTAAEPTSKVDFFGHLRNNGDLGWLDGELTNLSESFGRMCEILGNTGPDTNAYISCTGMFNSDLSKQLEGFAREEGFGGFAGLLKIAPYEFAWYGEFVYAKRRDRFRARNPHLMTLACSEEHASQVRAGTFLALDHHFGVMFQPPAAHILDPEEVDALIASNAFRQKRQSS